MVLPGHAVRGVRLQLHRPDRRPRPRRAGADARERAQAQGPAVPARRHAEGLRLRARRGRPDPLPRRRQVRPGGRHRREGAGARRRTRRCSATGCATWRRPIRGWSRSRRRCAKARAWSRFSRRFPDRYFDVGIAEQHAVTFAAGLACEGMRRSSRSTRRSCSARYDQLDPRRRAAEPAGDVRDRPRRAGRRRRRDAPGRVRPLLPALPAEHDGDGARRRGRVPQDADDGVPARHAGGGALSARQRARASRSSRRSTTLPVGKGVVVRESKRRAERVAILAFGAPLTAARGGRRDARRDGREHALRQAARRGAGAASSRARTTRS